MAGAVDRLLRHGAAPGPALGRGDASFDRCDDHQGPARARCTSIHPKTRFLGYQRVDRAATGPPFAARSIGDFSSPSVAPCTKNFFGSFGSRQVPLCADVAAAGQIARRAGFDYPEYMGAAFKRVVGLTPGQYRAEHRSAVPLLQILPARRSTSSSTAALNRLTNLFWEDLYKRVGYFKMLAPISPKITSLATASTVRPADRFPAGAESSPDGPPCRRRSAG